MKKVLIFVLVFAVLFSVSAVNVWGDTQTISNIKAKTIESGWNYTYAIKSDNALWGWGQKSGFGLEKYDDTDDAYECVKYPVKIIDNVLSVTAGNRPGSGNTFVIKTDGTLWGWGANYYGQIGDGTTMACKVPKKIMDDVLSVSSGFDFTLALKMDGTLWSWGDNEFGQLGDGNKDDIYVDTTKYFGSIYIGSDPKIYKDKPVKIMDDVVSIAAGDYCGFAIKRDGSLWAWGKNNVGELGTGYKGKKYSEFYKTNYENVPTKIMENAISVNSGGCNFAIKSDGSLWGWGGNEGGTLGDGTRTVRTVPVKIIDNVSFIEAGSEASFAVKTDGSLWAWGGNRWGELGDGTFTDRYTPVKIIKEKVIAVSMCSLSSFALKSDGSIWAWGANVHGELGDGNVGDTHNQYGYNIKKTPAKMMTGVKLPYLLTAEEFKYNAKLTSSRVLINSEEASFDSYNINNENWIKIRDIAMALNGTNKHFQVEWDNTNNLIILTTGKEYIPIGDELKVSSKTPTSEAKRSSSVIKLDGKELKLKIYSISGNNYFRLRDIAKIMDFNIIWDQSSNTIRVDTTNSYSE